MTGEQVSAAEIVTDGEYALIAAAFADKVAAADAITTIRNTEAAGEIEVEGVLAVRTDETGKILVDEMTDHSTKSGLKWGAVGGIVLGVIFPPSIIASAAVGGVAGGLIGHFWRGMSRKDVHELGVLLDAGQALLIVVGRDKVAEAFQKAQLKAVKQVEKQIDLEVEDLKKELEQEAKSLA